MPCYHPLEAVILPGRTANGKRNIKILSGQHASEIYPSWQRLQLPCGQCIGCRLEYSRQWANRCMLELQYHMESWFVTLTYDDEHVPRTAYAINDDGEAAPALTLKPRDLELFWKRLRKAHPNDHIRYFACGEYGSSTARPHYHAIIFGLSLDDLRPYKRSPQGYDYFVSDSLNITWGLGYVVVGAVTWETCAYTARYIMKKLKGQDASLYSDLNLVPEFVRMSRKPGIARQYYDDHPDLYKHEYINLKTDVGGLKFRPPRYYDKLFDIDHPGEMEQAKVVRRRLAAAADDAKSARTNLDRYDRLAVEELALADKLKSLERKL